MFQATQLFLGTKHEMCLKRRKPFSQNLIFSADNWLLFLPIITLHCYVIVNLTTYVMSFSAGALILVQKSDVDQ